MKKWKGFGRAGIRAKKEKIRELLHDFSTGYDLDRKDTFED